MAVDHEAHLVVAGTHINTVAVDQCSSTEAIVAGSHDEGPVAGVAVGSIDIEVDVVNAITAIDGDIHGFG